MEIWQWILTAAAGVVTIGGAVSVVRKWTKPLREHSKRVSALEKQNARDLERFDLIAEQLKSARAADQAMYKALVCIMNHMIDGNGVDKLKKARQALEEHIISQ